MAASHHAEQPAVKLMPSQSAKKIQRVLKVVTKVCKTGSTRCTTEHHAHHAEMSSTSPAPGCGTNRGNG
jgi:hypothetical protein